MARLLHLCSPLHLFVTHVLGLTLPISSCAPVVCGGTPGPLPAFPPTWQLYNGLGCVAHACPSSERCFPQRSGPALAMMPLSQNANYATPADAFFLNVLFSGNQRRNGHQTRSPWSSHQCHQSKSLATQDAPPPMHATSVQSQACVSKRNSSASDTSFQVKLNARHGVCVC